MQKTGFVSSAKKTVTRSIHGKVHTFKLTEAVCDECGLEMNLPGLLDTNALEINQQYRCAEHILSVREIKALLRLYNLGKAPLSLAMGFGEVTIARYLDGQIPSQEYSDRMRKALASPDFMKSLLEENRDKLKPAAWRKGMESIRQLEGIASLSPALRQSIAEVLSRLGEVTPLLLQKLLYYIQGLSLALQDQPVFPETCQAWIHGPVYPGVYQVFRDFAYNPIDDDRFAILRETEDTLTEQQKTIINLVTDSFGLYGGKVLDPSPIAKIPGLLPSVCFIPYSNGSSIKKLCSLTSVFRSLCRVLLFLNISFSQKGFTYPGKLLLPGGRP